jgi:signal transduction histidine kinase
MPLALPTSDFQLLFEESAEAVVVLLPDRPRYTMVAATRARLAATGATREQTIGHGFFEAFPDNPDDPENAASTALRASLDRVLATRAPDTMPVTRGDVRGPDGKFVPKYWSPRNAPILSADGEVKYILHRVQEVTELVQAAEVGEELRGRTREMERDVIERGKELAVANERLRETNARLGELDTAKTAFFSNVSHEFRTPLTLILGPVEDAVTRAAPLEGEALRSVQRNALRLLRLVNSLLDFSRVEAGRTDARFEATDLAALTAGLAGSFRSLVESAGLDLVVDCPPLPEPVYVGRSHWEKIVLNLVSNAFKFTFSGTITVRLAAKGEAVELVVSDTGTGIPEREHARIFERFHRVDGARGRSFEGTGIGLALVRELVNEHGGTARVESEVGRGTTFTVTIPTGTAHLPAPRVAKGGDGPTDTRAVGPASYVLEASQWVHETPRTPLPPAPRTGEPERRVLVADDNADVRAYLEHLLSPHWTVQTVADGTAALAAARAAPPDLILTDAMMPGLDGFALLRALRAAPRTRAIPVIVLSARAGEEAVVEGLETGADDYLVKPFSARELLTRVRAQLDAASKKTSALRASETRFRRLAESGIIGISIADAAGRIVEANETFLAMVKRSRDDLLGGALEWNALVSPPGPERGPCERVFVTGDGTLVPALVATAPLEGEETIRVSLDLTERKRLEEQFRQAQKMEAVGRLAGGVAHDFNNLLSVILSYTELRMPELDSGDPLRGDLAEIRNAGLRAAELTKQLLTFSRRQVLASRVIDLNESVGGTVKMLRRLLGEDIDLTTVSGRNLWKVRVDPGQMEQVVINLAVNARDAMPNGGKLTIETANVELGASRSLEQHELRPGPYVMLTVTDTGIGMDAATQARVFEPFFTTKGSGKGTGLGLATVFGIVKQSDGHILLSSEPEKGTVFRLYFPRVDSEAEAPTSDRLVPDAARGSETILLVEDDEPLRVLARGILQRSGYTVLEASNGGEAILAGEQHDGKIDLLLTDVVLPRMSGAQLAERMALRRPEMKALFMSGYAGDAVAERGVFESRVAFIQKPITPASLSQRVREVLRAP